MVIAPSWGGVRTSGLCRLLVKGPRSAGGLLKGLSSRVLGLGGLSLHLVGVMCLVILLPLTDCASGVASSCASASLPVCAAHLGSATWPAACLGGPGSTVACSSGCDWSWPASSAFRPDWDSSVGSILFTMTSRKTQDWPDGLFKNCASLMILEMHVSFH